MAEANAKTEAETLGIWTPKTSQLCLAVGGIAAWLVAIALTLLSKSDVVATAFVAVGAPLLAAAAFYSRVRKFTKDGVELDPLHRVRELDASLPPPADDVSALEERRSVIEAVEAIVAPPVSDAETDETFDYLLNSADRGVQTYERALRLERAAQDWLLREGYQPEPPAADRGVDFVVRGTHGIFAFEVKSSRRGAGGPTPESLHAYYRQARIWADTNLGQQVPFFRVLITDVIPPPNLLDRYRKEGIGLVRIEPEDDEADWVLQPRDAR